MIEFHGLPWWNWALQAIGVSTSYAGAVLNARLDVRGFYIWFFSNVTLFLLHALTGLWLLCLLDVMYFRINMISARTWKKSGRT
jgi:hypothetical protein